MFGLPLARVLVRSVEGQRIRNTRKLPHNIAGQIMLLAESFDHFRVIGYRSIMVSGTFASCGSCGWLQEKMRCGEIAPSLRECRTLTLPILPILFPLRKNPEHKIPEVDFAVLQMTDLSLSHYLYVYISLICEYVTYIYIHIYVSLSRSLMLLLGLANCSHAL